MCACHKPAGMCLEATNVGIFALRQNSVHSAGFGDDLHGYNGDLIAVKPLLPRQRAAFAWPFAALLTNILLVQKKEVSPFHGARIPKWILFLAWPSPLFTLRSRFSPKSKIRNWRSCVAPWPPSSKGLNSTCPTCLCIELTGAILCVGFELHSV